MSRNLPDIAPRSVAAGTDLRLAPTAGARTRRHGLPASCLGVAGAALLASCGAKADAPSSKPAVEAAEPAQQQLNFAYSDLENWELYDALLMTGLTGARTTVLRVGAQLEVRQVEKTEACSHIVTDLWIGGKPPKDDANFHPYVVCPLSSAPPEYKGGEKWLMTIQEADLNFHPTSEPTGWAVEAFPPKRPGAPFVRSINRVLRNADGSANGHSTYTLWRDMGRRYVMADFSIPDDAVEEIPSSSAGAQSTLSDQGSSGRN